MTPSRRSPGEPSFPEELEERFGKPRRFSNRKRTSIDLFDEDWEESRRKRPAKLRRLSLATSTAAATTAAKKKDGIAPSVPRPKKSPAPAGRREKPDGTPGNEPSGSSSLEQKKTTPTSATLPKSAWPVIIRKKALPGDLQLRKKVLPGDANLRKKGMPGGLQKAFSVDVQLGTKELLDLKKPPGGADLRLVPSDDELNSAKDTKALSNIMIWYDHLQEIYQYRTKHGDCLVPKRYGPMPHLGTWCCYQRQQKRFRDEGKKCDLTQYRVDGLNKVGFDWTPKIWKMRFLELQAFHKKQGHCNVTKHTKNVVLLKWMDEQRAIYRQKLQGKLTILSDERIEQLNNLGFDWRLPDGNQGESDNDQSTTTL
jgi:hypothetical protein